MRLELPPKFSLSNAAALTLLLAALVAARTGYLNFFQHAAPISPAFADGHKSSSKSESGGEKEGGSGSSHSGEGSSGNSYSGGEGSGSSGGGSRDGGAASSYSGGGGGDSGGGGGQRGGDSGYMYSGSGSTAAYSSNGSSGYTYSGLGGGNAVPRGDGRPPSVGVPQPELKGLPKELRLDDGKDNKSWEDALKSHWDTHVSAKEAERAPEAKWTGENAGRDTERVSGAKVSGEDSGPGTGHISGAKEFGEDARRDTGRASEVKRVGEDAGRDTDRVSEAKKIGENAGRDNSRGSTATKSGKAYSPAGSSFPAMPDPRSYSRTEVLAASLSPAGAARARALGFQIGGPGKGPGPGHGPGRGGISVMTLPPGLDPAQGMRLLQQNLPGEQFQLNNLYRIYQPAMKQDGDGHSASVAIAGGKKCGGDRCYAQEKIHWKDRLSSCTRNVKIGVIDTGFDMRHPAFKNQKIEQKPFLPAGKSPASTWHGTGVLALLAGRPDSGTPGLAPEATYHAASVFYAGEGGDPVTDTVSFMRALDWMSESGVSIVNMSFSGPRDDLVRRKIEALSAKGLVFTAAAGNDGPSAAPAYPAAYPQVIAVTAVTKDLKNYPYANRGAHIDVAAPGVDIWTAWPEAREGYRSGTSFASPFVAGVLAIYPPDVLRSPKDTLLERVNITDLGIPGRDPVYGRGLLQAPSACQGNASEIAGLGAGDVEVPRLSPASAPSLVEAPFHTVPAGR